MRHFHIPDAFRIEHAELYTKYIASNMETAGSITFLEKCSAWNI
jgi:hypothetical protein